MTGFDIFSTSSEMEFDSFRCFTCDLQFINALDALTHINTHLIDIDQAAHLEQNEEVNENEENLEIENDQNQVIEKEFEINLSKWTEPNTIASRAYEEMIQQFGEAECPLCPQVFRSKIAWTYHYISDHKINLAKQYPIDDDTLRSIPSLKNQGIDQEVVRFLRNNQDFDFDLVLTEVPGSADIDKYDDIPVSTSKNMHDSGLTSSSQINFDKYDDIPVSTKDEVDFDPPSPIITPKNRQRARVSELNSNDSGNGSLEENSVLPSLLEEVYEELIEDECFEVWLDFAVVPALIEDFRPYVQKQKQLRAKLQTQK